MFIYFANNGSLLISIIFLSSLFKISGFAPFGIGLVVFILVTIFYINKFKRNYIEEFFDKNTVKSLKEIPCTIIKLVPKTYECCHCQYNDIETTTTYCAAIKKKAFVGISFALF